MMTAYAHHTTPITSTAPTSVDTLALSPATHDQLDQIVRALGLEPLSNTALQSGQREIRIWAGGGLSGVDDLYRIVDDHGVVHGQIIGYWESDGPDSASMHSPKTRRLIRESYASVVRYGLAGQCDRFAATHDRQICLYRFIRKVNWQHVLQTLDADSIESLPDQSRTPLSRPRTYDGWGYTVEVRDGGQLRRYSFSNANRNSAWSPDRHAFAINETLIHTGDPVPSNPGKRYKGIWIAGPDGGTFHPCHSDEVWGIRGGWVSDTPPFGDTTSTQQWYLDVRGKLANPAWFKSWGLPYAQLLDVDSAWVSEPQTSGSSRSTRC